MNIPTPTILHILHNIPLHKLQYGFLNNIYLTD